MHVRYQHPIRGDAIALLSALFMLIVSARLAHGQTLGLDQHSEQGHSTGDTPPFPRTHGGFVIESFARGLGRIESITAPVNAGFDGPIFVAAHDENLLLELDERGQVTIHADLDDLMPGGRPFSLTMDRQATYSGALLLYDARHNLLCEVAADGTPSVVETSEDPIGLVGAAACDPYGDFDGKLILADGAGALRVLEHDGSLSLLATGLGHHGHSIGYAPGGPLGSAVFVADSAERRIVRVEPDHPAGDPAPTWVDLSAYAIDPVGLAISIDGVFGEGTVYVADATAGRIVALGSDGSFLGDFVTGLAGPAQVELPREGLFAGTMLITCEGAIWVVEPAASRRQCPADIDGSGDMGLGDLLGVLSSWGRCPGCPESLDGDGAVGFSDLLVILSNWGPCRER